MLKSHLQEKCLGEVRQRIKAQLGYRSIMESPQLEKIAINFGLGKAVKNPKIIDKIAHEAALITGQKAVATKSKKSVSNFKLREGVAIGVMVTLRGVRMYHFLAKLIQFVLSRVRDFKGLPATAFDRQGNYTIGLAKQHCFPEINLAHIEHEAGMNITLVFKQRGHKKGDKRVAHRLFLEEIGMPFKKEK